MTPPAVNTRMPEIQSSLDRLGSLASNRSRMLIMMQCLTEMLMANEQDALDEIAGLKQAIADDQANDQKAVDELEAQVQDLEDKLAASGQNTTDFSSVIAAIRDVKSLIVPVTGKDVPQNGAQTLPGETQVPIGGAS